MRWWRRREEPIHEKLAREGGLSFRAEPSHVPARALDEPGIHGLARPRRWDAVEAAEAPDLPGDNVAFVALPDGSLLVEDDLPDGALAPLAQAVESTLRPPYRAEAVRQDETRWAVAARAIEVVELPEDVAGDEVSLAVQEEQRTLLVDGARSFGSVPALEALAAGLDAYVVHAERLDGSLWEVKVASL